MNKDTGLENRYDVWRLRFAGGEVWSHPVEEFCFVLKPFSDPKALAALEKYADKAFIEGYDALARDLRRVINEAKEKHRGN